MSNLKIKIEFELLLCCMAKPLSLSDYPKTRNKRVRGLCPSHRTAHGFQTNASHSRDVWKMFNVNFRMRNVDFPVFCRGICHPVLCTNMSGCRTQCLTKTLSLCVVLGRLIHLCMLFQAAWKFTCDHEWV